MVSAGPDHVCALIVADTGHLLLEQRPHGPKPAAGRLTCFGGKRLGHETIMMGLRRELLEECGITFRPTGGHVDLYTGKRWIARFLICRIPRPISVQCHAGHAACWLSLHLADHPRVSRWHRLVLKAWRAQASKAILAIRSTAIARAH